MSFAVYTAYLSTFLTVKSFEFPSSSDMWKTCFGIEIGFLIYLPFLVVDMVVSCILMAMGMFMLSPMTISTPFKLLMFVLVDGWQLIVESLVKSFK